MRLLLLRHGQTGANVRGELDTAAPGPGLTALGRAQAAAVPEALRGERVDAVLASTLVRAGQTAAPFAAARELEVLALPGLREIEAGDLELATDRASYQTYFETCVAWGIGQVERSMPGGTDGRAFFERFDASIAIAAQVETAVVVTHAAAMRVWVAARAVNIEPMFVTHQELDNTGLVELEGSPGDGWRLVHWRGEPVGGAVLADDGAEDPTGADIDDALA